VVCERVDFHARAEFRYLRLYTYYSRRGLDHIFKDLYFSALVDAETELRSGPPTRKVLGSPLWAIPEVRLWTGGFAFYKKRKLRVKKKGLKIEVGFNLKRKKGPARHMVSEDFSCWDLQSMHFCPG
jgi:hypothetical protein